MSRPPEQYPEPTVPLCPTKPDSWTMCYGFDQYLVEYGGDSQKGWGVFGRASISDGNPTPIRYFLSAGIGGDSAIRANTNDRWGIGYYYVGASNEFGPIPQFLFGPRDGMGLEMYYNVQVNPWLNVTPDIQFIRPEAGALADDDAVVFGVRVNLTL